MEPNTHRMVQPAYEDYYHNYERKETEQNDVIEPIAPNFTNGVVMPPSPPHTPTKKDAPNTISRLEKSAKPFPGSQSPQRGTPMTDTQKKFLESFTPQRTQMKADEFELEAKIILETKSRKFQHGKARRSVVLAKVKNSIVQICLTQFKIFQARLIEEIITLAN